MHQRIPRVARAGIRKEQAFDGRSRRLAAPEQPRREHPCVIDDQHVSLAQQLGKLVYSSVVNVSSATVELHEARLPSRRCFLSYQPVGQIEIEVGHVHVVPIVVMFVSGYSSSSRQPRRVLDTTSTGTDSALNTAVAADDREQKTTIAMTDDEPQQAEVVTREGHEPGPMVIQMPVDVRNVALSVIAGVGLILFLQYAQAVLIPVILATLLFYALDPIVDRMQAVRVPRAIGAALVLLVLTLGTGYGLWTLRDDAMAVVEEMPRAAAMVRQSLRQQQRGDAGAIEKLQQAAKEIDKTAVAATGPMDRDPGGVQRVQVVQPFRASDYLMWGSMGAAALAAQMVMILFLAYFMLVADDLYKRKLVRIAPTLSKKKITVQIVDEIGTQIERFMLVQILTSAIVAVATAAALWWIGLEQPVIWGLVAGVLNSIPYFGPIVVSGGLAIVAFLQFETFHMAFYVAAIAMVITTLEGWLITPTLMGRAASINPAAIFVGILFWSWIWGVWGLVLAVPMLMMTKAVCDRIEELQPIGELLGE
jgi:predicted PurR-regulated permease PerM